MTFLMKCNPASFYCNNTSFLRKRCAKQDSIPLGYVPPTWKPYVFPVSVATTRCHSWEVVGPQMTKSEQFSSDLHWMSVAGEVGPHVWCLGERGCPYNVTYPMMYLMLPTPPCERTGACENITFWQLRLRAVNMYYSCR